MSIIVSGVGNLIMARTGKQTGCPFGLSVEGALKMEHQQR